MELNGMKRRKRKVTRREKRKARGKKNRKANNREEKGVEWNGDREEV